MQKAGLVLLNYNDSARTVNLARKSLDIKEFDKICVVDNCSTDDSYVKLKRLEKSDKITVLQSGANKGYASGNNIGARFLCNEVGVDIVFIANPDVEFNADLVRNILNTFDEKKEYGVLGAIMQKMDGNIDERPYIKIPTYLQEILLCFYSYNRYFEKKYPYTIQDKRVQTVDAIQGSLFAVRSSLLEKVGYLDENTFLFYEEMCLAKKISYFAPEYKEGLVTDAFYRHNHSASIKNSLSEMRTYRIYMKSKLYFNKTYQEKNTFLYILLKIATLISRLEKHVFCFLSNWRKNGRE